MDLRKVTLDSREVFRKRRIQMNSNVSFWNDEFDCGGEAQYIITGKSSKRHQGKFGVSKREVRVSSTIYTDMCRGIVNGAG